MFFTFRTWLILLSIVTLASVASAEENPLSLNIDQWLEDMGPENSFSIYKGEAPLMSLENPDITGIESILHGILSGYQPAEEVESTIEAPKKMWVRVTYYNGLDDRWGSKVAWNKVARAKMGRTVAADPSVLPYGTWIDLPGFGQRRVEDTGSAVKSRKASQGTHPIIDVYVETEKQLWKMASSMPMYVEITVLGTAPVWNPKFKKRS